jgi:DNA modification methylase
VESTYKYVESETERKYALGDLTGPGGVAKKNPTYEFLGVKRYWRYSKTTMLGLLAKGRIAHKEGKVPLLKRYLDEMKGKPLQDIWTDIKFGCPGKIEFPTQKPEALLERIIIASSNPNQLVYDPFSGSGTTGAVCFKLSRRWIGSETLEEACLLSLKRLEALGCNMKLYSKSEPGLSSPIPLP